MCKEVNKENKEENKVRGIFQQSNANPVIYYVSQVNQRVCCPQCSAEMQHYEQLSTLQEKNNS